MALGCQNFLLADMDAYAYATIVWIYSAKHIIMIRGECDGKFKY